MTAKKLQQYLVKKSKISQLSASSFMMRVLIYSSILFSLIAIYNFDLGIFLVEASYTYSQPQTDIEDINREQELYYSENQQFNDYPEPLKKIWNTAHRYKYNYRILSSIGPVQSQHNDRKPAQFESTITIAEPKNMDDKSYIGVVFAFKINNQVTTTAGICETNSPTFLSSTVPSFDKNKIICPAGTTLVSR